MRRDSGRRAGGTAIGIIPSARRPSEVPAQLVGSRRRLHVHWRVAGLISAVCCLMRALLKHVAAAVLNSAAAIADPAQRAETLHVRPVLTVADPEDIEVIPGLI